MMALVCLFLVGCVTSKNGDKGMSFQYEWWVPIVVFIAGIVFVPVGIAVRNYSNRTGWGLMILGPIAALGFAPSLFMEQVLVHDRGFDVRSGIWGMTANQKVDFDAVTSVRLTQEETGGRRSRLIEVLYFDQKSGSPARLPLNNDLKIEAAKEIVTRTAASGIQMIGFE
jgi:hypothetical protein